MGTMNPFFSVFATRHNNLNILYNKKFEKKRGFCKKVWKIFIFLTFFWFVIKKKPKYLQKWRKCAKIGAEKMHNESEKKNGTQRLYRD